MADTYLQSLYMELMKYSFTIKANEIRSDMDFFRKKESRLELRKEFDLGIRPVFLKYLPLIDKTTVETLFSETQQNRLQKGCVPIDWSVHHQKPLSWGGRSFNPDMLVEIKKFSLTEDQERLCQTSIYADYLRFGCQIDNFLQHAHKKGVLKEKFTKLFRHYLILMPLQIHKELEDKYFMPQVEHISGLIKKEENRQKREVLVPLYYTLWDQFIYGGTYFFPAPERKIIKMKEDHPQEADLRKLSAYLRRQRQRDY